jgi:hypothetical protein
MTHKKIQKIAVWDTGHICRPMVEIFPPRYFYVGPSGFGCVARGKQSRLCAPPTLCSPGVHFCRFDAVLRICSFGVHFCLSAHIHHGGVHFCASVPELLWESTFAPSVDFCVVCPEQPIFFSLEPRITMAECTFVRFCVGTHFSVSVESAITMPECAFAHRNARLRTPFFTEESPNRHQPY